MMKRFISIFLLVACGGENSQDLVPGQEGRLDGDVWSDGMFNSPEAREEFCANSDAWFCTVDPRELEGPFQSEVEKWKVAEYHGLELGGNSCYGPNSSSSKDCLVPFDKYYTYRVVDTDCFTCVGAGCPNNTQAQAVIDGVIQGMRKWNGKGGAVMVAEGTAGTSGYVHAVIDCNISACNDGTSAYACAGPGAVSQVRESDLPIGPHGKDQKRGVSGNTGFLHMNVKKIWQNVVGQCGTSPTAAVIKATASSPGAHEAGHMFGFDHFSFGTIATNVMNPYWGPGSNPGCSVVVPIQQVFSDALTIFSPGNVVDSVPDVNLENLLPQ